MARRELSVRRLGRLSDPTDPERGRRRVQRHLSGLTLPSVPSRRGYAAALGLPEDYFLDEDEEEDVNAPLTRAVIRQTFREELRLAKERIA